ncbi:MAG: lipoyl(octanoyl) transferase LipB [Candidatus Omnitrophota bacterium]
MLISRKCEEKRLVVEIRDLGIVDYKDALDVQTDILRKCLEKKVLDTLIVVEHNPVLTLGRSNKETGIVDRGFFNKRNIPIISTGRGGEITYHSPGQIVLYPIIDLREKKRDISLYIDFLEKTISNSLNSMGVEAERRAAKRGVWVQNKKIGFIGIGVKNWVTFHGAAVNINNDITPFSHINPCGERDIKVISAKECAGYEIDMREAKRIFADQFIVDFIKEYR